MGGRKRRQVGSFLISLIFHVFALMTLALCYHKQHIKPKPIQISVEIQQVSDIVFISEDKPLEITIPSENYNIEDLSMEAIEVPELDEHINIDINDFKLDSYEKTGIPVQKISNNQSYTKKSKTGSGDKDSQAVQEFKKRLKKYKGKTGDIQVSLIWDNHNDIDLHVKYINDFNYSRISWMNKKDEFGGFLDIDMNSVTSFRSDHPIENVYWATGRAPRGIFKVYVHHYACTGTDLKTPVKIMIKVNNITKIIDTFAVFGEPPKEVYSFTR